MTVASKCSETADAPRQHVAHTTAPRMTSPVVEEARARPRTNEDCEANLHGSAHAAKEYGCICKAALDGRDERRKRDTEARRERRRLDRRVRRREELQQYLATPADGLEKTPDGDPVRVWPDPRLIGNVGRGVLRDTDQAACVGQDPEMFFALDGTAQAVAKGVCHRCPIEDNCLTWALQEGFEGVFGGTTYDERVAIRRSWKRAS